MRFYHYQGGESRGLFIFFVRGLVKPLITFLCVMVYLGAQGVHNTSFPPFVDLDTKDSVKWSNPSAYEKKTLHHSDKGLSTVITTN